MHSLRRVIPWCLIGVVVALGADTRAAAGPQFDDDLAQAERALRHLGEEPSTLKSVNYHILYTGRKEFAEARKRILEAVRRNFLGFMRRMLLNINERHGRLLVIVLDAPEQMRAFHQETSPDEVPLNESVAGYYSPRHNWAVFYNQREGADLAEAELLLNGTARRLIEIPGGPETMVEVDTPRGKVRRTKLQVGQDMKREWQRIISAVNEYNTALTQHEGAHQLAFNVGVQHRGVDYPLWLSEGLACVFEVPPREEGGRQRGAARGNGLRLAAYRTLQREKQTLGLRKLVCLDARDRAFSTDAVYAESWAAFAFMFQRHPGELSAYLGHLAALDSAEQGLPDTRVAELERFFQQPINVLQHEFDQYIERLRE